MFATRQRAGHIARQLPRAARSYASEAHGQHKAAEVNESFGVRNQNEIAPSSPSKDVRDGYRAYLVGSTTDGVIAERIHRHSCRLLRRSTVLPAHPQEGRGLVRHEPHQQVFVEEGGLGGNERSAHQSHGASWLRQESLREHLAQAQIRRRRVSRVGLPE